LVISHGGISHGGIQNQQENLEEVGNGFYLDGVIKSFDRTLLRCLDEIEAKQTHYEKSMKGFAQPMLMDT
jgi:hypothetical protein